MSGNVNPRIQSSQKRQRQEKSRDKLRKKGPVFTVPSVLEGVPSGLSQQLVQSVSNRRIEPFANPKTECDFLYQYQKFSDFYTKMGGVMNFPEQSMELIAIVGFFEYISTPKHRMYTKEDVGFNQPGLGLAKTTLEKYRSMFNKAHICGGHTGDYHTDPVTGKRKGNPIQTVFFKNMYEQEKRKLPRRETKHAKPYDIHQLYTLGEFAVRGGIESFTVYVMMVLSFWLFTRFDSICELNWEHVSFSVPGNDEIATEDEIPERVFFKIDGKTTPERVTKVLTSVTQDIGDTRYCPVRLLCVYMAIMNKPGCLLTNAFFPRFVFDGRKRTVDPNSRMDYEIYKRVFKNLFEEAGFKGNYTSHSSRRSAARHAAMCGGSDSDIKQAGDWKTEEYITYTSTARGELNMPPYRGVGPMKKWIPISLVSN